MTEALHNGTETQNPARSNMIMSKTTEDASATYSFSLYHGTSSLRLQKILDEGRLLATDDPADPEYCRVSLSTDKSAAEFFACDAAWRDAKRPGGTECNPIIIELDGHALNALFYELDPSERDWWEHEIRCYDTIEPLAAVLIGTEVVPIERLRDYREKGIFAFPLVTKRAPDDLLAFDRYVLHQEAASAAKWWG